jgi:hypothetical protein
VIEDIVFERATDMRLLIGFFYWANQMGVALDITKWAKQIEILRFDSDTVHAIAALVLHARSSFRECNRIFRSLVQIVLEALGSPMFSRSDIKNWLKRNRGVEWLLARNLILIDAPNWTANPIVVAAAKETIAGTSFAVPAKHQRKYSSDVLSFLSQLLVEPGATELVDVPTCYDLPSQLGFVNYDGYFPVKRHLPTNFLYSLLTALEGFKVVPWEFEPLFSSIELDDTQITRIRKLLHIEKGVARFYTPALFDPDKSDYNWLDFFSFRPPSFSRSFFRSLTNSIIPPVDAAFVEKVSPVLTPVFPAFAVPGASLSQPAPNLSLLRAGELSSVVGDALLSEMTIPSRESVPIFQNILRRSPVQWKALFSKQFSPIERDAVIRTFLNSGASSDSNINHGLRVIETILATVKPDLVMPIIGSKDFLNQPNFPAVFVMFKRFEGFLRKGGMTEFLTFCDVFHHRPRGEVFDDEFRIESFKDLSNLDSIVAILRRFEPQK